MFVFGVYNNCVITFLVYCVCIVCVCSQQLWSDFKYEQSSNCSLVTGQYLRSNSCGTPIVTFVTIPPPKPEIYVLPGKVAVKRCDGFCFTNADCVGDQTELVPIPIKTRNIATNEMECGIIYVSQDITCKCV